MLNICSKQLFFNVITLADFLWLCWINFWILKEVSLFVTNIIISGSWIGNAYTLSWLLLLQHYFKTWIKLEYAISLYWSSSFSSYSTKSSTIIVEGSLDLFLILQKDLEFISRKGRPEIYGFWKREFNLLFTI